MKQDGGRKRSWGWVVVAGVVAAPVLVFVWGFVVGPRLLLWQYDRFVARHEPGTRVEELARDPFLRAATMIVADEERIKDLGQPSRLDEPPRAPREDP